MAKLKIKKGDNVVVIHRPRSKGTSRARCCAALPRPNSRLVVQGVHISLAATRGKALGNPGGIVEKELTIHISNVAHVRSRLGQADAGRLQDRRLGRSSSAFARRSGEVLDK